MIIFKSQIKRYFLNLKIKLSKPNNIYIVNADESQKILGAHLQKLPEHESDI